MTWAEALKLIIAYGVPQAFKVWEIVTSHDEPTQEAWDKLQALALKDFDSYVREAQEHAKPPPA